MKRFIYKNLKKWKDSPTRKPLILLGARQVGKTYILKQFGKEEFDNMVYVNCHNNPFVESLFVDFDIDRIIYQIELQYEQRITIGKTLLFFDEIQEVKNGIPSLKSKKSDKMKLRYRISIWVALALAGSLLWGGSVWLWLAGICAGKFLFRLLLTIVLAIAVYILTYVLIIGAILWILIS